ncbi:MAG: dihydroorotase [Clostridia bacterium]|nr:dihydroorotase [Clostridia bacterium]
MESLVIKNGTIITDTDTYISDILVENGVIAKIGKGLTADKIYNADGKHIFPGLVDMHVHLREPGYEYKEDINSGCRAAVSGGFTQIACMPNTKPVCDNAAIVGYILMRSKEVGLAKVLPIGAVTKDEKGEELAEIGKMKKAGIVAISDDGQPVWDARLMRLAMEYAEDFGLTVFSHCEDKKLSDGGVVNEGYNSSLCGLKGIPRAAEEVMVAREIILAETLNKKVHICHISTKGSVALIREAKKRGVKVTAETCPHYFSATDDLICNFDAATKVNPPLREDDDVKAIIAGLKDGTIDAIATDHAPHHNDEKNIEYNVAAFGISGLETAFALAYTVLVKENGLSLNQLVKLMSRNPSAILGVEGGEIRVGAKADITVCDLNSQWVIDSSKFFSKGKNTPFNGRAVCGNAVLTIVDGKVVYKEGNICG